MITILVDTKEEYLEMMEYAMKYICSRTPFNVCGNYAPHTCNKCYKDNHIKCGIRVISVDNSYSEQL